MMTYVRGRSPLPPGEGGRRPGEGDIPNILSDHPHPRFAHPLPQGEGSCPFTYVIITKHILPGSRTNYDRAQRYGRVKTKTLEPAPGFNSGANRNAVPATSDAPVLTATNCLPPTE